MKQVYFLILVCFYSGLSPFVFSQEESEPRHQIVVEEPSQYLPEYLNNIYIGMSFADFENIKDTLELDISDNAADMWVGAVEEVNQDGIDEVIYKFDKEEDGVNIERPLYQINIKFAESDYEDDFVNEKFRHYNWENYINDSDNSESEEWVLKTNKDYLLIIKKINDSVQIIATMAGTEWDPKR